MNPDFEARARAAFDAQRVMKTIGETNLLAPARGELLVVRARVVRAGREVHVATMLGTMMTMIARTPP